MCQRQCIENLGYQLCIPHIKKRLQSQSLKKHVLDPINSVIEYLGNKDDNIASDEVSVDNSRNNSVKPSKCHLGMVDLFPAKRDAVNQTQKLQQFCVACKKRVCPRHLTVNVNREPKYASCQSQNFKNKHLLENTHAVE